MSTTTVRIADHMQVKPKSVESTNTNSGRFDGQISALAHGADGGELVLSAALS